MVTYESVQRVLRDLDKKLQQDEQNRSRRKRKFAETSTSDVTRRSTRQEHNSLHSPDVAEVNESLNSILMAFFFAHQGISDRGGGLTERETAGSGPDCADDVAQEELGVQLEEKTAVAKIQELVLPALGSPPAIGIILGKRVLRGDKNHKDRKKVLYFFLRQWNLHHSHLLIRDCALKKILVDDLKICSTDRVADRVVAQLNRLGILIKYPRKVRRKGDIDFRDQPSVYWIPNRRMFQRQIFGINLVSVVPVIMEIVASLQLDRDVAIETLRSHGILDEYNERRSTTECVRNLIYKRELEKESDKQDASTAID